MTTTTSSRCHHIAGASKRSKDTLYAVSTIHEERVYLHRFLMGLTDGKRVKHLDGNTLNNQRGNLATTANPFLGVSYVPKEETLAGHPAV